MVWMFAWLLCVHTVGKTLHPSYSASRSGRWNGYHSDELIEVPAENCEQKKVAFVFLVCPNILMYLSRSYLYHLFYTIPSEIFVWRFP